jgi:NHLM bacteriocin system ABC transporter ATP-binding protein
MGWFDEQIRERMKSDQELLEDSYLQIAGAVLGNYMGSRLADEQLVAKEALDDVLKYYHYKPVEVPDTIHDVNEQLDYVLRPLGLMTRDVTLEKGWYKDAFGPMLGVYMEKNEDRAGSAPDSAGDGKEPAEDDSGSQESREEQSGPGGTMVALLPGRVSGYRFRDPGTGKMTRITRANAARIAPDALCFYRPLPMKSLGIPDLLLYMKNCISSSDVIQIFLATLAVTLTGMIEPKVYQMITGPVLESRSVSLLMGTAVFLLSAAFASQLLSVVRSLVMSRISTKASLAVESSVMMRLLSLPLSFFRRYSSGELSSRTTAVSSLCSILLTNIFSIGLSSLLSLLYITQIFNFTPLLVWPSIVIILVTVCASFVTSLMQIRISREKMKLGAQEAGMSYAMISGIRKIRLSGSEKRAFARWGRLYARNMEMEYNPPMFLKINSVIMTAISLIGNIVLYYLAVRSGVGPSGYFGFSAAYGRVMGAFSSLAGIAISVASIPPVLEMAEPILKTEPEITSEKEVITSIRGSIELNHIAFRYEKDTPLVFEDLSLKIRAGEYVAIVGRTGCGKSTLVRLLLGFEKPEKGAIYYDGHDLNRIDPRSLRKKMGVVTQNGQLFQGDIFANITISAPHLTLKEAWEAAETAGIAQDIREMPMGMNTIISEGTGGISGGQKQRLMIARAVAPKPDILILDEATSALDNKTQKQVSEALDRLRCTRIVIAHRLSTIRNCDRILLIEDGKIAEEGTYEELIEKGGSFARLVERQRLDT